MSLRVVFGGTPDVAVPTLQALCSAEDVDVVAVVTRPDRAQGRGRRVRPAPVKQAAVTLGLPVLQPDRASELVDPLRELGCDAGVVVAYGALLPPALLAVPRLGFVNLHFSLLPRWRGAAPVQHAIRAGDQQTGLTVFRLAEGLDDGPIIRQLAVPIAPTDDAGTVLDRLAARGPTLVVDALRALDAGEEPREQPSTGATYAPKLTPADLVVAWNMSAPRVADQIRSLAPRPGARTTFRGAVLKVLGAQPQPDATERADPGTIVEVSRSGVVVACASGTVTLASVQPEGRPHMAIDAFVNGYAPRVGERCTTSS